MNLSCCEKGVKMKATGYLRLKRGIWQIVIDYLDENGQRHQCSESTGLPEKGNKRRAQKILDDRLEDMSQQYTASLESKNILFLTFMRDWLNDVVSYKVKISTMTQYLYVFDSYIAQYKPFHGVKLQALTPALLQSYYNAQLKAGLSPNTVRKHHANIHKCLDYAVRMGKISLNPSIMTELPAKRKYQGATAYTPEQLKTLLRLFRGEPLETAVQLTVTYGLRRSEVCGLRWDAVDFEAGTIHVCHTAVMNKGKVVYSNSTKTDSSNRVLPLTANMREYLQKVRLQQAENKELFGNTYIDSGYVCVHPNGAPIRPDYVTPHFQRRLREIGLPVIRFHDLRHSAVYALRKGGCNAKDSQAWLGHSDITTTLNVYGHVLGGDMDRLGRVMDSVLFRPAKTG